MDVSSLNLALPTAGDAVPKWVHLMPAGTFKGITGDQTYHLRDPAKVIAASMTAGKLALDENHSTQRAPGIGAPSPARGWIVELQARDDGIWGRPDWNPSGVALMTDKAYRNISPVFRYDAKGNVTQILSAALTNNPNLAELVAMHTQPPGDQMEKKAICTALGVAETADDATVLVALQTAAQALPALSAAEAEVARLKGEVATLKATYVPATEMVSLQTRLNTLEAETKKAAAVAFIDAAIKAGKPINSVREQFIAQHVADPAATETLVNGLVSINAAGGGSGRQPPKTKDGLPVLTAQQVAMCTKMGTDPKKYAEFLQQQQTTEGSAA